jgi:superfamily II DNA or RNA helicase
MEMDAHLRFDTETCQHSREKLTVSITKAGLETLFNVPDRYETAVSITRATSWASPVRLTAIPVNGRLFARDDLAVSSVAIDDFPCPIYRFSFAKRRKEPGTSLFQERQGKPAPRVAAVPRPPRPPSAQKLDLEEILRWILTPPIHEILSDPQLCLPAKPYPFQTSGIKWLYDRDSALLADEMGLGKTMQAIIAARLLWRERLLDQILIVCPKTLISTWTAELKMWWPQIGDNVMLPGCDRQFFLRLGTPNVVVKIINYEAVAREAEWLKDQAFSHDLIIIDEAQRIKNADTKTSQAVKALKATRRWALTGTPLENKVEDVVSILQFVQPGLLKSDDQWSVTQRIGPYMLRRRTEEVRDDLPDRSDQDIPIELDASHRRTYDQMEREGVVELNAKGDNITVTHVFALISRLRQICNFDPVDGRSAKLERLLEDLEEVRESGRKALIFSQFVDERYGLKRLSKDLGDSGYKVCQLHGEVRQNAREAVLKAFRTDPTINALLLNYSVGGVGLNLQVANYVFLFDRWWNPAVEDQAVKRAHRIGQAQKVFVRRFYCTDTIEERILKKLAEKRRLFHSVIDQAHPEAESLGLTEEEIFSLFNLSVRPKKAVSAPTSKVRVNLDGMDPTQFEELVAQLYEKQGYAIQLTGGSHDGGIDILAERDSGGARERVVIQCKHQQANVGRPILQQLWGVLTSDHSFTRGDLVTSSSFTTEAEVFAAGKRLGLVDRVLLMDLVRRFGVAEFA